MEKLILTSKVLYDKDIDDKRIKINELNKELTELKKQIEKPKVSYSSFKEYTDIKELAFKTLKEEIADYFLKGFIYDFYTIDQLYPIGILIEECLFTLTKNKDWSEIIARDQILYGIRGFINGMIQAGVWEFIFNILTNEELSDMIYNNIIWQLENYILDDTMEIKCEDNS